MTDGKTEKRFDSGKLISTLERRIDLNKRLAAALNHLGQEAALFIVCSFIDLDKVEEIVEFQERV